MDASRWERVQVLFEAAADLPPEEGERYLQEACGNDDALLEEVRALLYADHRVHSLLDGLALDAVSLADALPSDAEQALEGRRVGPYRLVCRLGAGGMGVVYLAERADGQFEQQVALKLIKRGMDSEQIVGRFQAERQILARLKHPNIARLLDGGVSEEGQPYFAMEYVDGQPIDRYSGAAGLSVEARLALFLEVCRAVQYAHSQLIVHRDLKPSNILVTEEGQVKLLDFGIAKMLGGDAGEGVQTRTGVRVLTPAYASPEQLRGEGVTTGSDVYALGVVLYELLTGRRPNGSAGSTEEPDKPSTVVSRGEGTTSVPSGAAERTRWRRRLEGDLDTICLKALCQEPERRYGSVEALMEDVGRHLSGLPVLARRDTVGYRVGKFVNRHRAWVGATGLVLALVAALVSFYTVRLAQERDRARIEAEKAAQVSAFLQSLFAVSNPSESKGETVTARSLLDEGAQRVETELADQPEVAAKMMQVIGDVYLSLGLYGEAGDITQKALDHLQDLHGDEHAEVAATQTILARIRLEQGDQAVAESLHTRALAVRRRLFGAEHMEVAESLKELAYLRQAQGDYEAAIELNREVLAIRRKHLGEEDPLVATALNDLANALREHGEIEAAESLFREAIALQEKLLGDDHPEVANTVNNLALLLQERGEHAAAEPLYRRVLAIDLKTLGPEHPYVAISKNNLAQALQGKGAYAAAESLFRESLALRRQLFGDEHPAVAESFNNLGVLLVEQRRYEEAEPLLREALAIQERLLGPQHPRVAISTNALAGIRHRQGAYDEAEALYRRALELYAEAFPDGHLRISNPTFGLGSLLAEQGNCTAAEPLLRQALDLRRKGLRAGHRDIAHAESVLGGCLVTLQQLEEAEALLLSSYADLRQERGDDAPVVRQAAARLVHLYEALGQPEKAAAYRVSTTVVE